MTLLIVNCNVIGGCVTLLIVNCKVIGGVCDIIDCKL